MSFHETSKMLLLAYDNNIISDDEFLGSRESYRSKNPDFPHSSYARFELQNIDEVECLVIVHKEQSVIEWKVYACYLEDFLTHAVIQTW